jgi:hypothetical protein
MQSHRADRSLELGNQAWQLVMRQGLSFTEAANLLGLKPLRVAKIVLLLARKRLAALESAVDAKSRLARRAPEAQMH